MENKVDITSKCNFSKGKNYMGWWLDTKSNNNNIYEIEGMEFVLEKSFSDIMKDCNMEYVIEGDWRLRKIFLTFDKKSDATAFKLKYL